MSIPAVDLRSDAIMLDIDGTILDLAPTPQDVAPSAGLLKTLRLMSEFTSGAVALVSGRMIADIDRIFAPLRLVAVGGHGAEIRRLPDSPVVHRLSRNLDEPLREALLDIGRHLGLIVEDKGFSVAVHYRLAPEKESEVRQAVERAIAEAKVLAVDIVPGKAVIEVKAPGFNKGTGVRELMTLPAFSKRRPVFVGDDITDEAAFSAMPDLGGFGISVGREIPGVLARFDAPRDVRRWLAGLCEAAHGQGPATARVDT